MIVRSISISRKGDYGYGNVKYSDPLIAKVKLSGDQGEVELILDPDMSQRICAIVSEEFATAGRRVAEAMVADILTQSALPPPKPTPASIDDEIPF